MAMLAEPRRKQKWSVDPRNSAWSKDDSKFGQKMLERMGWSKGKGLGKTEQGATEHIKVKVKNNSLGLGTNASHEDNWIAHQDDFNQLLADLNNCHGQSSVQEPTQEEKQENFSLEQKSKSSRKRVHYMKFTKGKDLSSRSETDLACIFGKRSKPSKDQDEDSNSQDSHEELVKESQTEAEAEASTKEEELNTVTSTLTMQEYFAQRMAQLKKARQGTGSANASSPSLTHGTNGLGYTPTPMTSASETPADSPNISDTEQQTDEKQKKKKKKRRRENDEEKAADDVESAESVPAELTAIAAAAAEETAEQEQSSERKKKKKKKKQRTEIEDEGVVVEECTTPAPVQEDTEISSEKKKKKKKMKTDEQEVVLDSQANVESKSEDTEETDSRIKKKKGKREGKEEQPEEEEVAVVEQKKSKKDKKKNKKRS